MKLLQKALDLLLLWHPKVNYVLWLHNIEQNEADPKGQLLLFFGGEE